MISCADYSALTCGSKIVCFIYDFQTFITGIIAIVIAFVAAMLVRGQLKDSNLQGRISRRETLAMMVCESQTLHARAYQEANKVLSAIYHAASDLRGEGQPIGRLVAYDFVGDVSGLLDWYLIDLKNTEHEPIEEAKAMLAEALANLSNDVHVIAAPYYADRSPDDYIYTDDEYVQLVAKADEADQVFRERVIEATKAARALQKVQNDWTASLKSRISDLDQRIANYC